MKQDPRTIINTYEDHTFNKPSYKKPILRKNKYVLMWKPDKLDTRDYQYQLANTTIPFSTNLRPYCSPIEDQGNLGSCTGQAIAGAIELLNKRNGNYKDISRLFIYYYERLMIGTTNYDSGAYIRDGIKVTNKYGASLEKYWPYNIGKYRQEPVNEAKTDALKRKVTLYERVLNITGCINALANGYPVIVGFTVYSSFMTANVAKTGNMPYPNTSRERILGGHCVLLVGYDKNKNVFIARNSWGTSWGDNGYFYMPFNVISNTNMSGDFWVIKTVNNT